MQRIIYALLFFLLPCICTAQLNIDLVSQLPYADQLSSLWGYTDDTGNEYALVGTVNGLSIVDISDPETPDELFFIAGNNSAWREIKTWQHYAYVTNEGGGGLLIVDLNDLPISIDTISFTGTADNPFITAHTLFIDENGILYLFGYNVITGYNGAYILDLSVNPLYPEFIATYNDNYIHDAFVRNDTMWAAEIYNGRIVVFDVSDKSNFIILGTANTPALTAHNCEPSADGRFIFATDEFTNGYISAFNAENVLDIQLMDKIKHGDPEFAIPHNVHVVENNFLVASHYSEGVIIVDASKPDVLVETGHFDTSPFEPGGLLEGAWEVYPFFNSGLLIVSDIQEGLFVLQPEYIPASYLQGTVSDAVSLSPIPGATIHILETEVTDSADIAGVYSTGYNASGVYMVMVSATGCATKMIYEVALNSGETTVLDVLLDCGTVNIADPVYSENMDARYDAEKRTLCIALPEDIQNARYTILNMNGNKIVSGNAPGNKYFSVPLTCGPGTYVLQITQLEKVYVKKFIVY